MWFAGTKHVHHDLVSLLIFHRLWTWNALSPFNCKCRLLLWEEKSFGDWTCCLRVRYRGFHLRSFVGLSSLGKNYWPQHCNAKMSNHTNIQPYVTDRLTTAGQYLFFFFRHNMCVLFLYVHIFFYLCVCQELDWKSALIIIAGITLQGCVCGALMRPLEPTKRVRRPRAKNLLDRIKEQAKGNRNRYRTGFLVAWHR